MHFLRKRRLKKGNAVFESLLSNVWIFQLTENGKVINSCEQRDRTKTLKQLHGNSIQKRGTKTFLPFNPKQLSGTSKYHTFSTSDSFCQ